MKRMWLTAAAVGVIVCATPCVVLAADAGSEGLGSAGSQAADSERPEPAGVLHRIALYIPNRVLDVFDVVRLRARLGPGVAADVRATRVLSAFVGSYATIYAGLPGPRNSRPPKLPVGLESRSGLQASLADATATGGFGPDYGPAEIGVGVQAVLVGVDIGVEPLELLDLAAGLLFIDLRDDDL